MMLEIPALLCCHGGMAGTGKPDAAAALALLKEGNARFAAGTPQHPHQNVARLRQAGVESQDRHAFATVLSCSDSRVPVELIFDEGVMDLFVVRVAGNICGPCEAGSIEYGLAHVHTPVLVVLGHTQCGAVTAAVQQADYEDGGLERNIPAILRRIGPAVARARADAPDADVDTLVTRAVEENVWLSMETLFVESPAVRDLVKRGAVKAVGAIYDIGTGRVDWLPEERPLEILAAAEALGEKAE